MGLIAVGNNAAKNREEKPEDAISARTTLTSTVTPPEVQLILTVRNSGQALWLSRPFLTATGFVLEPHQQFPVVLAAGATAVYVMHLEAPCVEGQLREPVPDDARMLLPALTPSGERHSISIAFTTQSLSQLGERACGLTGSEEPIGINWSEVRLEKKAVSFTLTVSNQARDRLLLHSIAGPGLSVSVAGGFPKELAPTSDSLLRTRLTIPSCKGLPEELDQLHRFQGYEPFSLVTSSDSAREVTLPIHVEPDQPLLVAIRDLVRALCPTGSFRSG